MVICIEGVNGAGKTSLAKKLATTLGGEYVRLPGNNSNPICMGIREILQNNKPQSEYTNLMLYFADMAEWFACHDKNKLYILDRSFISTLVYQCNLGGVNRKLLNSLLTLIGADAVDACILLTCDADEAVRRLNNRETKTLGNYKNRNSDFYASVQNAYLEEVYRLKRDMQTFQIDTTNISKQETFEKALLWMKNIL